MLSVRQGADSGQTVGLVLVVVALFKCRQAQDRASGPESKGFKFKLARRQQSTPDRIRPIFRVTKKNGC